MTDFEDYDNFSSLPYWNFQDALQTLLIENQSKQIAKELQELIDMKDNQLLTTTRMIRKKLNKFKPRIQDGVIQRWDYKGSTYYRDSENKVWIRTADELGDWVGVYLPYSDELEHVEWFD